MTPFKPMKSLPHENHYKKGDVMVVFGELFARGYANGIVDEAAKAGMTIVRSTVGRRDDKDQLRALTSDELSTWAKPYINVPLEAGFDMEPSEDGTRPIDQLQGIKMAEWDKAKLDFKKIEESRLRGVVRFRKNVTEYLEQLETMIPKGANVLFVHTMAGGVPRAKIMMPTMNRIFKGTGDRHESSEKLMKSDLGVLAATSFNEVTAETFRHLLELSRGLRERLAGEGGSTRYVAYGYHGTEVLVKGEYTWQTYTPYFQGWAKMALEKIARDAFQTGVSATVYNCPEILTNSSSVFSGVELSLYPLVTALNKEGAHSAHCQKILKECQALLQEGVSFEKIQAYTDKYITSALVKSYSVFEKWPQHNGREQMENMLNSSDYLISLHKDAKSLMTAVLSEEVFKATGRVMFNDSFKPTEPVWWLGHDVLAKQLARF